MTIDGSASRRRQGRPQVVAVKGIDFEHPVEGDPVLLLDSQRMMIRRLKLDVRAMPTVARAQLAFQLQRIGVAGEAIGEPGEPRSEMTLVADVKSIQIDVEVLLREHRPNSVAEVLIGRADDRKQQNTANEEILAVENAEILCQHVV